MKEFTPNGNIVTPNGNDIILDGTSVNMIFDYTWNIFGKINQ